MKQLKTTKSQNQKLQNLARMMSQQRAEAVAELAQLKASAKQNDNGDGDGTAAVTPAGGDGGASPEVSPEASAADAE